MHSTSITLVAALSIAAPFGDDAALVTRELREGVDRGLAFLVKHQNRDGSFGVGAKDPDAHVGVTALAGLALLAGGHLPDEKGDLGTATRRAIEAIAAATDATTGLVVTERTKSQPMYSHAFATLFLAEAYGMTGDADLGPPLRRAVDLIVASQNPEGGWRYYPGSKDADLSVTACQATALRAARNAGVAVPYETIERAAAYVIACFDPGERAFRYQAARGHASFHLTAAAITALHGLGYGSRPEIEAAFPTIGQSFPGGPKKIAGHFLYGQYYALQAAHFRDRETFAPWYSRVRDKILAEQRADGAIDEPAIGDLFGTAMGLIVLELPYHFLPILTR